MAWISVTWVAILLYLNNSVGYKHDELLLFLSKPNYITFSYNQLFNILQIFELFLIWLRKVFSKLWRKIYSLGLTLILFGLPMRMLMDKLIESLTKYLGFSSNRVTIQQ